MESDDPYAQYKYFRYDPGEAEQLTALEMLKLTDDLARNMKKREPLVMHSNPRIGRAERDQYADHLADMYSKEYLDDDEFGTRKDQVAAAKTLDELKAVIYDLPALPAPKAAVVPVVKKPLGLVIAKRLMAVHTAWKLVWGLFFALAVAIGPSVYEVSQANGINHLHGMNLVVYVLSIVLGTVGAVIFGATAFVRAIMDL